jgi:voltage-gated potassium channel
MRYPPLLIAMFLMMILRPFAEHLRSFDLPSGVFELLIFLALIYAFRHVRSLAAVLTVLAVLSVTSRFVGDHWGFSTLEIVSQGLGFIAMVLVIVALLSEVLRARTASTDLVIGAVCLYLVIGLAWMYLYYSMYLLFPGSIFVSPGPRTVEASEARLTDLLYFSLAALTTIGSSGEPATTTLARQLGVVESAMGQLYLAVLISRLVGFSTTGNAKAPS